MHLHTNKSVFRYYPSLKSGQFLNTISELQNELNQLKAYIEDVFTDYNDINEDTRMQIELINQSLAELHTDKKRTENPRNRIGFIQK